MKKMFFIGSILLFTACNSKDDQFCKCLQAGEELNDFSTTLFEGEITDTKAKKLETLKENKEKECADYQTMKGEEMLKRKSECK